MRKSIKIFIKVFSTSVLLFALFTLFKFFLGNALYEPTVKTTMLCLSSLFLLYIINHFLSA